MTDLVELLQAMGARISGIGTDTLEVDGVDTLHGASHTVIPDRIEAGTYAIAGALCGDSVTVAGCRPDHLGALLEVLRASGVTPVVAPTSITVRRPAQLKAVSVTTTEFPGFATDLQAQTVAFMTQADGVAEITEAIFESRFQHALELMRLGAHIEVDGRTARITGPTPLTGAMVMASDLRASAALVLAGLVAEGETVVDRIYHLDRGYESMEQKLLALGAAIERFNPGPFV
ncbi:MAG TPA: hypothetical protein PLS53_02775 [Thermoanaerobaculaceae bacterium]|nr:hypothetical protein [Thermoanaerobaculaceae bacterium]